MKKVAVIAIKLNNESLSGINIKLLNSVSMIHYVLQNLLSVLRIYERYVFCSCVEIQNYLFTGMV